MLINIVRIFQRLGDSDRNDDVAVTRNSGLGEIILVFVCLYDRDIKNLYAHHTTRVTVRVFS